MSCSYNKHTHNFKKRGGRRYEERAGNSLVVSCGKGVEVESAEGQAVPGNSVYHDRLPALVRIGVVEAEEGCSLKHLLLKSPIGASRPGNQVHLGG